MIMLWQEVRQSALTVKIARRSLDRARLFSPNLPNTPYSLEVFA